MTRLLALETSTEYCSVALWQDGNITSRCELAGQRHSEMLLAIVDEVLREARVKLAELDGIAYGKGPGSFTGVRIACGVTQGLALGANLPVLGVCTLQALAYASGHDKIIAALDARMGEIYHAAYQKAGQKNGQESREKNGEKNRDDWVTVCAPNLCSPQQAPVVAGSEWFGTGSGFGAHREALHQRYGAQLLDIDAHAIPNAQAIVCLAVPQFAAGCGVDAAQAMPLYLRDKVALKTSERR